MNLRKKNSLRRNNYVLVMLALLLSLVSGGAYARPAQFAVQEVVPKLQPLPLYDAQGRPIIQATSALLIDANTGAVLFSKDPNKRIYPASTTKIMTALLTLEHDKLDETTTISEYVTKTPTSSLNLMKGEKITVRMLLWGALIRSANDACVALGEHISGSEGAFVNLMNKRAKELGAKDTHFVTTNGLHDPNHYTTASDMALFARRAIQFPLFNQIVCTRKACIERSMNKQDTIVFGHNRLLNRFPGADGIKTGYTKEAGRCLVGSATRGGWRLISLVFGSPDVLGESQRLLEYGFRNYERVVLIRKGQRIANAALRGGRDASVPVIAGADLSVVIPRNSGHAVSRHLEYRVTHAPVHKGESMGVFYASVDGIRSAQVPLIATRDVKLSRISVTLYWLIAIGFIMILLRGRRSRGRSRTFTKNYRRRRTRFSA